MSMADNDDWIPPTGGGSFLPCPEGPQRLVCCDLIDKGMMPQPAYGDRPAGFAHKVIIRFQSEALRPDGTPFEVQKMYTYSFHEKSNLRKDIGAWRGKALSDDEAKKFSLKQLLGLPAFANIIHKVKGTNTYGNIQTIMPMPKGMATLAVVGYVRQRDRPQTAPQKPDAAGSTTAPPEPPPHVDEDEVPF